MLDLGTVFPRMVSADTYLLIKIFGTIIQGRKLIKGGNYQLLGGFCRGNYSREETIQGRKLFTEIRYLE